MKTWLTLLQEKEGGNPRQNVLPEGGQRGSVSQESGRHWESRSLAGWMLEMRAITICLYCYHLALQNINSALLLGNHMGVMKWSQLCFVSVPWLINCKFSLPKVCLCRCLVFIVDPFCLRYLDEWPHIFELCLWYFASILKTNWPFSSCSQFLLTMPLWCLSHLYLSLCLCGPRQLWLNWFKTEIILPIIRVRIILQS